MEKKIALENKSGTAVRTFRVRGSQALAVYRKDKRRLELWENTEVAESQKIPFEVIQQVEIEKIGQSGLSIGNFGVLRSLDFVENTEQDPGFRKSSNRNWWISLATFAVVMLGTVTTIRILSPQKTEEQKEEMKTQVVQIIKKVQIQQQAKPVQMQNVMVTKTQEQPQTKPQNLAKNVKRMGALAVLGSLSSGKQKGGLNLGAVNTTAGAGLGGSGGSGGTQTSLYAKGIVSAPVGPGGNINGAGGYGTKGKGGGQAGYGSLSLVGSAGSSTIPLGQEAIVEGGLDRDLIAQVVARNMGQVRFCYEQGLQLEPNLAGRVMASWTINGQGVVVDPGIASTTLNSKTVEDCILLRLRSWKFPLPQGGVSVKVQYPFMLKRVGT